LRSLKYKCVHFKANLTFYSKRCSRRLYPQLFVGGFMSYVCFFVFACVYSGVKHVLNTWITWRVSYKRQKKLTIRKHLDSSLIFCGVCVAHRFRFLCCVVHCFCVLFVFVLCLVYSTLPVSLDCVRPVSCVLNIAIVSGLSSSCVLCTQHCQCLWIVFVLCLVYSTLPLSLDCLRPVSCVLNIASASGFF
jgi:hypothetical protein